MSGGLSARATRGCPAISVKMSAQMDDYFLKRKESLENYVARTITQEQREVLQTWIAARNNPQKVVFRSQIVLAAANLNFQSANLAGAEDQQTDGDAVAQSLPRRRTGGLG